MKSLHANARRKPLRLVLLTDAASLPTAASVLAHEGIPFYHSGRLEGAAAAARKRPPAQPLYVDFVDIDLLREHVETPASAMKVSAAASTPKDLGQTPRI